MNLSDIYGKRVISLNTATVYGSIQGVHIDKTTYAPLFVSLSDDGTLILDFADMYGKGDVVSTFAEPRTLSSDDRQTSLYIGYGAEAFDVKGKFLGTVSEYTITGSKRNKALTVGDRTFHPRKLVASDGVLVFNTGRKLPSQKKDNSALSAPDTTATAVSEHAPAASEPEVPTPAIKSKTVATATETASVTPATAPASVPETKPQFQSERPNVATISPETLNFDFLLGRTTKRNISDLNGLLLIPIGTIISRHIIENARKNGKLSELAISSR